MNLRTRFGAGAILAAAIFLIGCKPSNPNAPVRVSGQVTYNGSAVPGGTINFHMKDGSSIVATGNLDGAGKYSISDMPEGEFAITVETESINPSKKSDEYRGAKVDGGMASKYGKTMGGGGPAKGGKAMPKSPAPDDVRQDTSYVKIPAKYAKPSTSGLSVALKRGDQKFNADLTD